MPGKAKCLHVRQLAVRAGLRKLVDVKLLCRVFKCGERSYFRWLRAHRRGEMHLYGNKKGKSGRKTVFLPRHIRYIEKLLALNPTKYYRELGRKCTL